MLNWHPGRTQLPAGPASERGVVGLGPGPRRRRGRRKTVRGLSGTLAEPVRLGSKSDRNRYRDCYDRSMLLTRSGDSILNGGSAARRSGAAVKWSKTSHEIFFKNFICVNVALRFP